MRASGPIGSIVVRFTCFSLQADQSQGRYPTPPLFLSSQISAHNRILLVLNVRVEEKGIKREFRDFCLFVG